MQSAHEFDYKTPHDLANYLIYLSNNSTGAYNSYFKWKKHVKFLDNQIHVSQFCDMCIQLNLDRFFGSKQENRLMFDLDNKWNFK
ncbi:MAG: glycosyltransferase family 10 domain-containing protein, partial [Candidatus Fonsibacter sp.]